MKTQELIERLKKIDQNLNWSINLDNYIVKYDPSGSFHTYKCVQLNSEWQDDMETLIKIDDENE